MNTSSSKAVAIIGETMAKSFFGGRDAIGRRIGVGCADPSKANIEIVGVVADARFGNLRDTAERLAYIPLSQNDENIPLTLSVRTSGDPAGLGTAVRGAIGAAGPVAAFDVRTVNQQRDRSLGRERLLAVLSGYVGGLALLLAGLGMYAVLSYSIDQRKREIGVRISLGAAPSGVLWLVFREMLYSCGAGLLAGIPAGVAVMRTASALLFGVSELDPLAIISTVALLTICTCLAAAGPAVRASAVTPSDLLRV